MLNRISVAMSFLSAFFLASFLRHHKLTRSHPRMLNSIVMAQSFGAKQMTLRKTVFTSATAFSFSRLPCSEVCFSQTLDIAEPQNLPRHKSTVTQCTQATPESSSLKIVSPDGGHLGCGIWQRLPRFPPSPVTLCLHLLTQRIHPTRASAEERGDNVDPLWSDWFVCLQEVP